MTPTCRGVLPRTATRFSLWPSRTPPGGKQKQGSTMALFTDENRQLTPQSRRIFALYEIARTTVDFLAAISFLVGSVLFFKETTQYQATWLFVIGSVFFCLKPTLKLSREIHLWRMGRVEALADRARD